MTGWILIFALTAGTFAKGDSSSMIAIDFITQKSCEAAGVIAVDKFKTLMKDPKYVCVQK